MPAATISDKRRQGCDASRRFALRRWMRRHLPGVGPRLLATDRRLRAAVARIDQVGGRWLARDAAWAVAVAAVLCLQIVLIATHRPWLDEAQALQIAAQSADWSDLLATLRYEGHPALWYALLRALAAVLPDPRWVLPLAAGLLALPAQLAILARAPFARTLRLALAISPFFLFEFFTLSRSLTLGVACALLAMALWQRGQWAWPFLVLLPQCDFLFGVIGLVLVGLRWQDRRWSWPWSIVFAASGMLAAWTVRPAPGMVPAAPLLGPLTGFATWLANIGTLALPLQWRDGGLHWNSPPPPVLGALALCVFAFIITMELRRRPQDAWIMAGFMLLTMAFGVMVYVLSPRHLMLGVLLLVLLLWHRRQRGGPAPAYGLRAWAYAAGACGLVWAAAALAVPFDRSAEAGALIRSHGLAQVRWFSYPDGNGQRIHMQTGIVFERLGRPCGQQWVRWDNPVNRTPVRDAAFSRLLREAVATNGHFYLLSEMKIADHPPLIRHLGMVPGGLGVSDFHFYEIGSDAPEGRARAPWCGPVLRPIGRF
ncbi:DUF2339 domain-containing protein [Novosphingobium sp. SG720]|uniref:DUF2339 domain-containing protein n=1 Tax=Novosphingobium sp. SG720 TaxID=2586998 RepID=UPI001444FCB2|nr:DUF2339 domain-containing protein [Novosphingobium sp. SG720]